MLRERIQKLKGSATDRDFEMLCYRLCHEFKYDYETLMRQPIPFIRVLIEGMMRDQQEQEKGMKTHGSK
jgi:hypothetical protein